MAAIVGSIEIARRPEDVFAYATDAFALPRMAGQRRVGPPGGSWPARRGLQCRRDPAARSSTVAGDRGDHRAASAEDLGVAHGRRPAHRVCQRHG
jgi:hypothetical protein